MEAQRKKEEINDISKMFVREMSYITDVDNLSCLKERVHEKLGDSEIFFWSEIARKILLSDEPTNGMFVDEAWSF